MANFSIDFTYKIEEYGSVILEADDTEQAEAFAREYVHDTYPEVTDFSIDDIKVV